MGRARRPQSPVMPCHATPRHATPCHAMPQVGRPSTTLPPTCGPAAAELKESIEGGHILAQFDNKANPEVHRKTTGPEIWRDTAGTVDFLVGPPMPTMPATIKTCRGGAAPLPCGREPPRRC